MDGEDLDQHQGRIFVMPRLLPYLWLVAACCGLLSAAPVRAFIIANPQPTPWLSTASGSRSGNGTPATITWSIVPDGTTTLRDETTRATAPSNLISFMNTTFGGNPSLTNLTQEPWFHLFSDSFGRWSQLGGVNYVYEPHDDGAFHTDSTGTGSDGVLGARGDIRLAGFNIDGPSNVLAFTYLPPAGGDIVMDTAESSFYSASANNFINFRDTLMHELGHSFALQHVITSSNLLMEPFIDTSFDGPQLDEVRGVQFFFGDANEKSNSGQGNGSPALATSLGTIPANGTVRAGSAANVPSQAISGSATDFVSISNAADVDYYSFTVSQASLLNATLTPRGGVFDQAPQNDGSPTSFDANARNNLAITVFGTNGTTVLANSDANSAGGMESIANLVLPTAGTYFERVTGADNTIQLYELSLSAAPILVGDYNRNGAVDAADYVVWRNTLGLNVATGAGADGDFNGQITQADYNVWRSHFGQVGGSGAGAVLGAGAEVPEPSFLLLAAVGFWLVVPARSRASE